MVCKCEIVPCLLCRSMQLYEGTSKFLDHVANACRGVKAAEAQKTGYRLLAELLAAICTMRAVQVC